MGLEKYIAKIEKKTVKKASNKEKKESLETPGHPFLKWAGGKRQLLIQIQKYLPNSFQTYIEPFVGAGALFFHLKPSPAILIDINGELINAYTIIKQNPKELIESLKKHQNNAEYYYKVRDVDLTEDYHHWNAVERASRTIFLNRCCYNGLYRVNSKGHFNVPFGKYENPKFCDEPNLLAVHNLLQQVQLYNASFETCLNYAKAGDFIYFDPPYVPISKTSSFTGYTQEDFHEEDQVKLKQIFDELHTRGCKCMLSNSKSDLIIDLYKDYKIVPLEAKRAINSVASKRGTIQELLIMNY